MQTRDAAEGLHKNSREYSQNALREYFLNLFFHIRGMEVTFVRLNAIAVK